MSRQFQRTALAVAATQAALICGAAMAQGTPAVPADKDKAQTLETVVVSGQRAALQSAQKIKQNSDEIVDSIVAEDIGKLPDRSVTEVLQRVAGITMDRAGGDKVHYSVEGSGVVIRGLTYVASQLNGRDTFSANGGRALSFEDLSPELLAGVDVYKNPSAGMIEGGVSGIVNMRTAMPFDFPGFRGAVSANEKWSDLRRETKPDLSGLLSNNWNTPVGKVGLLLSIAKSRTSERTDTLTQDPYYLQTTLTSTDAAGNNYYAPTADKNWIVRGLGWKSQFYDRDRTGIYAAAQWKKDNVESSLTYFKSQYKFNWFEYLTGEGVDPYQVTVSNAKYDQGRMISGTLTHPDPTRGLEVTNSTRFSGRDSSTSDLSWNLRWKPTSNWTLSSDLQIVNSKTQSLDSLISTGTQLPKQVFDLTGSQPAITFDEADRAYMGKPENYYWASTMEHQDRGTAKHKAWVGEARYVFEDNPVLNDLRVGVRLTDRDALTEVSIPDYNWATVTQAWQLGWDVDHLATITGSDSPYDRYSFPNFLGGKANIPAMYFGAPSVANGFPGSYTKLHDYYKTLCTACTYANWTPSTFGSNPAGSNEQKERTQALYAQLRFSFDDLKFPVDGNVGLRVIRTKNQAAGYTILATTTVPSVTQGQQVPALVPFAVPMNFDNSYTDALPTLNLRMKASEDLQFRFAVGKSISRPALNQLQAYTTLNMNVDLDNNTNPPTVKSVSLQGTATGNPMLKPIKSTQEDLTAEWYFSKAGSLTAAVFNKNLSDIIVNQTLNFPVDAGGTPVNFVVTGPANAAKGYARGFEIAYRQFFDKLPGVLSGLGLEVNYTHVNSKQQRNDSAFSPYCSAGMGADNLNLYINGCDTDGRAFGNLPLPNLSKHAANLALLYEKGAFSARLAYAWRGKYLQDVARNADSTGPNQTNALDTNPDSATYGRNNLPVGLPLWIDNYGQLDAGVQYKWSDKLSFSLDATNLTDATYKQMMQQHVGMIGHNWFTSGRRYTVGARYSF